MASEGAPHTATDTGVPPPVPDASLNSRKKRIREYSFQFPCDICEGQPPIPYGTVRRHLNRFKQKISKSIHSGERTESARETLLEFNDRVNEFNAAVQGGSWRDMAIERDSGVEQQQQSHVGIQEATLQEENFEDLNPSCGGYDDYDDDYDDDDYDGGDYEDTAANPAAEDIGNGTEEGVEDRIEEQQASGVNELMIDRYSQISFQQCTYPEDLASWLLDPVERHPPGGEAQKLVGDFCVDLLLNMLVKKYAIANITDGFNIISDYYSTAPSYNKVDALRRKIGSPFLTYFTCARHHPVTCVEGSVCPEPSCGAKMSIQIKQLKIVDILRRAMQDATFSQGVRYGPSLPRHGSDNVLSSVWQSPAMERLRLRKGTEMEMTDEYIPIVIELFTDGFAPYNNARSYSIWCVLVRILNLPPKAGKKYQNVYPLMIVDGPKEAETLDQYLGMVVKDIEDTCREDGVSVYDAARKSQVRTKVFLLCSAQDTRALRLVAKHDETPSQWPCHLCKIKGEEFKIGQKKGSHRVAYRASSMPEPIDLMSYRSFLWKDNDVRLHQKWIDRELRTGKAGLDNKKFTSFAEQRQGYRGICAFSGVPYFDVVNGFLICAMHGIQNAAARAESNVVGKFDTEQLRNFLNLTDHPKWVMRAPPRDSESRRNDPNRYSEKTWTQARNFVSFICRPSGLHGDPARLFRKPNASKKREDENDSQAGKIKASEWKDYAISGIICAGMYFGGVDPAVVKAYDGLFYALKKLCSPVVNLEEIQQLEDGGMYQIMLELENQLPKTEMLYHLHSLPRQVLHYGPLSDLWSFPFESKFKDMKSMAKKKNTPVASIASRLSIEIAVRSIDAAMKNHRERDGQERIGIIPTGQEDMLLSGSYTKITMDQEEDTEIICFIREYYVPRETMEDVLGRQEDWNSLGSSCFLSEAYGQDDARQLSHLVKQLALVEKRKEATDNSYLLLRQDEQWRLPTLARVDAIYRIVIPDKRLEMDNSTLDERVLLKVREYTLEDLDPELKQCGLQDVLLYHTQTSASERLIDVSCIQEQAFLAPDMRTIHGSLDEKPQFQSYLVLNKGSLRNLDLSKLYKEKPT